MKTMSDEVQQSTVVVNNLCVIPVRGGERIRLPRVYTQDALPVEMNEIPCHNMLRQWPHLHCLISEMPDLDKTVPIGLLIGVNCPKALQPRDFIAAADHGPFAVKTALGWCVSGPMQQCDIDSGSDITSCFRIKANETPIRTTEIGLSDMMLQIYESDFNEQFGGVCSVRSSTNSAGELVNSQEDQRFLKTMESRSNIRQWPL